MRDRRGGAGVGELGAQFGDQLVVVGLLVGQALDAVVAFGFSCGVGGGEFGAQAREFVQRSVT